MEPKKEPITSVNPNSNVLPQSTVKPVTVTNQAVKPGIALKPQGVMPAVTSQQTKPIFKPMTNADPIKKNVKKNNGSLIAVAVVITLLLGIGSGYGLYVWKGGGKVDSKTGLTQEAGLQREVTTAEIKAGTKVGVADERTFKDNAEGQLEKGGIDGEGSHHLVRPGGATQTLYITSSIIDLDQFAGRKVKVWGETLGAQKAGWLMDVGKLEVLE